MRGFGQFSNVSLGRSLEAGHLCYCQRRRRGKIPTNSPTIKLRLEGVVSRQYATHIRPDVVGRRTSQQIRVRAIDLTSLTIRENR